MIANRLNALRQKIQALEQKYHRPSGSVRLLAVSKTFPAEAVREAWQAGQRHFGENYLQDALQKVDYLELEGLVWHFIGAIQSNKTREIAQKFDWVHTLDREKIARRLHQQRPQGKAPLNCCIQVNISREKNKNGLLTEDEIYQLAHTVDTLGNLRLRGLMAIAAATDDFMQQKAAFERLKTLFDKMKADFPDMDSLSMGMTGDMEAAIAAGSTWLRIGSGIFGERA